MGITNTGSDGGASFKRWDLDEYVGRHPLLKRAWDRRDPVTLQLHTSQPEPSVRPKLDARVLFAGTQHRGELALNQNQVAIRDSRLTKAKFCVVGFPDFATPGRQWDWIQRRRESEPKARSKAVSDKSTLGGVSQVIHPPRYVVLESNGGWRITLTRDQEQTRDLVGHTGVIEKNSGSEFDASELGDVLEGLKYFFAFIAGAHRHPTVVIGYDSKEQPIWGQVGLFDMDQQHTTNWFNNSGSPNHGDVLEFLFPRFCSRWMEKRSEITAIIQCYAHSNAMTRTGLLQDAVAKSYTGLDMLAGLMAATKIGGGSRKKIHSVLSYCQIPNSLLTSDVAPTLTRLCNDLGATKRQGAYLLNSARNYIAHPLEGRKTTRIKKKHLKYLDTDPMTYAHLHDLSQFYIEYLFLRYCAYGPSDYRPLLEEMQ